VSAGNAVAVDINLKQRTLTVIDGSSVVAKFENISIGRGGAALLRTRGDGRTPLGQFRIQWINPNSKYHLFFGLDFPNFEHADRAWQRQLIDTETYWRIVQALRQNKTPPQDTLLGGYIGIHGLGEGDVKVHSQFNWTNGCIALTNQQIDTLARWVDVGTRVTIHD